MAEEIEENETGVFPRSASREKIRSAASAMGEKRRVVLKKPGSSGIQRARKS